MAQGTAQVVTLRTAEQKVQKALIQPEKACIPPPPPPVGDEREKKKHLFPQAETSLKRYKVAYFLHS